MLWCETWSRSSQLCWVQYTGRENTERDFILEGNGWKHWGYLVEWSGKKGKEVQNRQKSPMNLYDSCSNTWCLHTQCSMNIYSPVDWNCILLILKTPHKRKHGLPMWLTYPMGPKERVEPLEAPSVSEARALAKLINIKLLIMTFSSHSDSQRSIRRLGGGRTSCFVIMLLGERVGAH